MGKENSSSYQVMKPAFQFFEDIVKPGGLNPFGNAKPLMVSMECDMPPEWKGLGKGGGHGTYTFPCHCCPHLGDIFHI
jgi:hypothetical protein